MVAERGALQSTYRKSFQSKFPDYTHVYETNVNFRWHRRCHQYCHSTEPFTWDDDSENDSEFGVRTYRSLNIPLHKYKHEKFSKAYQERQKKYTAIKQHDGGPFEVLSAKPQDDVKSTQQSGMKDVAIQTQVDELKTSAEEEELCEIPQGKLNKKQDKIYRQHYTPVRSTSQPQTVTKKLLSSSKPQRPRYSSGPADRKEGKAQKDRSFKEEKPPFVMYGCQDKERTTGAKKTYNVKASNEIHSSALRALKMREVEKEEEKTTKLSARDQKQALYDEFNERMKRETCQWTTEYSSHFIDHDKSQYGRNLSRMRSPCRVERMAI